MTSIEAAESIRKGIHKVDSTHNIVMVPMADGGEGTVDAIITILGGKKQFAHVQDPLGRPIKAAFGWIAETKTAVIETAAASGLPLLKEEELDPYRASTYGTGQLLLNAIDLGAKKVILGLGGSATVDAGTGFLKALGVRFLDQEGNEVEAMGGSLGQIHSIDTSNMDKRLKDIDLTIASDVTNPLLGEEGAIAVFGPQKGVTKDQIGTFEKGMANYAETVKKHTGTDHHTTEGSGAAGGFGFSLLSFLSPKFESGFTLISNLSGLENEIKQADFVLTGEGKIDAQSLYGKVPVGIARIAKMYNVPTIAFAGKIDGDMKTAEEQGLSIVLPIVDEPMTLTEAMENGAELLQEASARFISIVQLNKEKNVQ